MISDALLGIVAQRLVRKVCHFCAEPYTPTEQDLTWLGISQSEAHVKEWRKGKGCNKCFHSGYLGREAIVELLDVDDWIRQIVYEGTMTQLHRYLEKKGFYSFRTAAIAKVTQGVTTLSEVRRVLPHSALMPSFQTLETSLADPLAMLPSFSTVE